jgi:Mannosyl-glycoprotein endo-beta-N-acetylglucosaminidase
MTIPIFPATRRATRAAAASLMAVLMAGTAGATAGATTGQLGAPSSATSPTTPTGPVTTPSGIGALMGSLQGDLARLAAIGDYVNTKQAVAAGQVALARVRAGAIQTVAAGQAAAGGAAAEAARAMTAERAAMSGADAARADLERRLHGLSSLAVALYVRDDVGVSRPADPTATGPDRTVMLVLLLAHEKDDIRAARHRLADAQLAVRTATARAGQADRAASAANAALALARAGQAEVVATANAGLARATAAMAAARLAAQGSGGPPPPGSSPSSPAGSGGGTAGASADQRGPPILGPPSLTAGELAGWFATTGYQAATTVPLATLAGYYIDAGKAEGVMGDIAFAQSILETGYFTFPTTGQLAGTDNNFAGIGACDSCAHGWGFPDAQTGVRAQVQLLHAYASAQPVATPLVGDVWVAGCCPTWMALTGVWATSSTYGFAILTIYQKMVEWTLPLRAAAAGL